MVRPANDNLFATMVIGSLPRPRWVQDIIQDRQQKRINIEKDKIKKMEDCIYM